MAYANGPRHINASLLVELSRLMGKAVHSEQKINQVLHLLSVWADLHYARVLLPNYRTRELEVAYSYSLSREKLAAGEYTVRFEQGLTGYAWRSGQAALVTDIADEPKFLHRIAEPIGGSLQRIGFISVPILVEGKTIGVLSAQRSADPRRRYADDVDLLRVVATMLAPILHSMQHRAKNISPVPGQLDRDSGRYIQLCEAHGIIGSSRALLSAVREIDQVKDSDAPIMLLGESGTGKEMFAGMAHRESRRRKKPFICINCASIPESLLESELFGHEKGSFTGAFRRQEGKIQQAHEGTLFLDEIGDMPLDLQAKLLRVLQDKHVQPIGSDRPHRVDFRLITATHVNLAEALNQGRFRLDLYYRLNVIPISLPRCASAAKTSCGSPSTSSITTGNSTIAGCTSPRKCTNDCRAITGRATSASCRTWSSARYSRPTTNGFRLSSSRRYSAPSSAPLRLPRPMRVRARLRQTALPMAADAGRTAGCRPRRSTPSAPRSTRREAIRPRQRACSA